MRKKIILLVGLVVIGCKPEKKQALNLLDCIPQNTFAALQLNDKNMLESALNSLPFLEELAQLQPQLYQKVKAVVPNDFTSNALLSFTPEGKAAIAVSFIYTTPPTDTLPKSIPAAFTYNKVPIFVEEVEGQNIYNSQLNEATIFSSSQLALENSIRNIQSNKKGIQESVFYQLAAVSDDNAPMNLYLHQDVGPFLKEVFPATELFPFMGSSWFSFDFNTKKDPFTLDGISFIKDSLPDKISLLKGLEAQPLVSPEYAPQNFDAYLALALTDYKALEDNFKQYSRYENIPLTNINFTPLSSVDEIAWIRTKATKALYFHLNNSENSTPLVNTESEVVDSYRNVEIKNQTLPKDIVRFLDAFGMSFQPTLVAELDDFLIFASDKAFLKQLIGNRLDGNTLENDFNFKSLQEDLADNSTFLWVGKTANLKNQWEELQTDKKKKWGKVNLKKYPLVALQGIAEKGFVQSRLTAQSDNPEQQKNTVISQYSFSLDAPLARAPQWIKNHRNKTKDVVVQDQNNVLYLFSNTGTLFWKKQLPGPIVGDIVQVDLYKNRRLQMAFRTPDRFMILDRNGKIVSPFNKKIASETPHHLAVFDYDLNRNYRFLLSHGKKVEMYDNRGKNVSGFRLKSLRQPLQHPPKHIRFKNKDYIVLQDIGGQIRILNRQGKDRIRLKGAANSSFNPVFEYRNTFATTTKDGDLIQIDTNGNLATSPLGLLPGHQVDMTTKSLVSLSENKLIIKGIPVLLPYGNYTPPKIHYINNTIYVTLTDLDTQKVYAYYSNGTAVSGFPVYGSSAIDLSNADNDKAIEMVVKSEEEGVLIYQIN